MNSFESACSEIHHLLQIWEPKLLSLSEEVVSIRLNNQNRTVRQILGHLADSASNNTHRIVHLQYRESPVSFPNYATFGNNDRWIAIQNYQHEDWNSLVQFWKYLNIHIIHVIRNVDQAKLTNHWIAGENSMVSLEDMIADYLPHLELHLSQIEELIG
jgi:hypothetical protein